MTRVRQLSGLVFVAALSLTVAHADDASAGPRWNTVRRNTTKITASVAGFAGVAYRALENYALGQAAAGTIAAAAGIAHAARDLNEREAAGESRGGAITRSVAGAVVTEGLAFVAGEWVVDPNIGPVHADPAHPWFSRLFALVPGVGAGRRAVKIDRIMKGSEDGRAAE